MQIRIGYEIVYACAQPTPLIVSLNVHPSRAADLVEPDHLRTEPPVPVRAYVDSFGNWCTRLTAPPGQLKLTADTTIRDSGLVDATGENAPQLPVHALPNETLVYLLPSRFCESDRLAPIAWQLFGHLPEGWPRVHAVSEWVHHHITFGYEYARPTKTAWDAYQEKAGVCRDFAHLGISFCRALNIPARYCTGYLGDIGVPYNPAVMDFAGYFEVWLGDRWYVVDPRNRVPRIGRVLIACGRDAIDAAITTSYGPHILEVFKVWTDEVR